MHGLIFEVFEDFVVDKFGIQVWRHIKEAAGCKRKDQGYLRRAFYEDEELVDLVMAASSILKISTSDAIEAYGRYFLVNAFTSGYGELLKCQGSTLRQFLSNLNAMHDYVKRSFPGDKFIAPVFWCEDCEENQGSILLHYYSLRGTLLVPLVVGIVEELASYRFDVEVSMKQIALQGEDGATFTSWRISAVDESQRWKLSPKVDFDEMEKVDFKGVSVPSKCPFSGRNLGGSNTTPTDEFQTTPSKCPFQQHQPRKVASSSSLSLSTSKLPATESDTTEETCSIESYTECSEDGSSRKHTWQHLNDLFPFHIIVDDDFKIINVGAKLPDLLKKPAEQIRGSHIGDVVQITRPVLESEWDWKSLNKLADQNFFLTPTYKVLSLRKKVSMADSVLRFQGSMYRLSPTEVMFTLAPDARNVKELNQMGLTLPDLPLSGCQRDAVFLGEHVAQEANKAHRLDKLSKRLADEKELSNTLLNNMLPTTVAENLRRGKTVEPAFHENVTLFFSDIVGFTNICDQVEPWDVIDMMNQLYSVMDFLASDFDLYKVETVGDSYMCCSGLPEPDEHHAEKVANFALAVMDCVKHVKSPVDGSPIQLRIGIHTGSCTSGVVGTLTPHYALFGDMVNTTSRHESTGVPGKIQCSSVLYSRLEHFSNADSPQYNFKARGLVDMKGKGEHYTYWLESGSESNTAANAEALKVLSSRVVEMLASKAWKKRRYFSRGSILQGQQDSSHSGTSTRSITTSSSGSIDSSDRSTDDFGSDDDGQFPTAIIDLSEGTFLQMPQPWQTLGSNMDKPADEIIVETLSRSLASCIRKSGKRMQLIQNQLRCFVCSTATIYENSSSKTSLNHIAEVVMTANFLWESRDSNDLSKYALGTHPCDQFVLLFGALIHQVKHTGFTNATLESEKHVIAQMYEGLHSCQQRRSVDFAFSLLEEEFGDLYDEITFGCPNFRSLVRKAVLSTDLENETTVLKMLGRCKKLNSMAFVDERHARNRNEANLGLILAIATVAPFTQSEDRFLQFSRHQYGKSNFDSSEEHLKSWYYNESMFLKDILLPLIDGGLSVLPNAAYLEAGATKNVAFWDRKGMEWIRACHMKQAMVRSSMNGSFSRKYYVETLVAANVDILESLLQQVIMAAENKGRDHSYNREDSTSSLNPVEEVQLSIKMKKSISTSDLGVLELDPRVRVELREFVSAIVGGYESNSFHNFLHASHVAHLANLLVKGIRSGSNGASDIAHDPLACFAIVFSALVHDVGHTGVPNGQLAQENPELADKYRNKSIAEQNSIDTAWEILMSSRFQNLQHSIFESMEERERFRMLLVNCVMATDIFDHDLRAMRKMRWQKAFSGDGSLSNHEEGHFNATIVIEHIMQTADVAHTMQDWEIYRHWNESLFQEMRQAYTEGRATKDPVDGWYEGELWFFDNWVIPLAENLKECGVLDIVSDELVKQARSNRQRWALEGRKICEELRSGVKQTMLLKESHPSSSSLLSISESSSTASYLASQMVSEVESLSRVMARYERKFETALGNLTALIYKGNEPGMDDSNQGCSGLHQHFRQQEWYRFHMEHGQMRNWAKST